MVRESKLVGAGLKHFPLEILREELVWRLELVWSVFLNKSFEKSSFGGWSWFDAFSFTSPLRRAHLEAGAGLSSFP